MHLDVTNMRQSEVTTHVTYDARRLGWASAGRAMGERLTSIPAPLTHRFRAAISRPAARSSLSHFRYRNICVWRSNFRVQTRTTAPSRCASLFPGLRAIRFPVKAVLSNSRTLRATTQLSKGTTSRLLSCARWPHTHALHWYLLRVALAAGFTVACFMSASFAMACHIQTRYLAALTFFDMRSHSSPG
jgi:hypothetical protein